MNNVNLSYNFFNEVNFDGLGWIVDVMWFYGVCIGVFLFFDMLCGFGGLLILDFFDLVVIKFWEDVMVKFYKCVLDMFGYIIKVNFEG